MADLTLSDEERAHIARAKWTVMCNGKLLPVTNLMSLNGDSIGNPLHAHSCVAYDYEEHGWIAVECKPGDIYPNWSNEHEKRFIADPRDRLH